ncbi:MAG: aminoacyl-tRNA hydrolase [Candidatus Buchananbacteria bacterium]|nr:aminoacyl-tRNA hydrolase [Candidatus Buchananbacteria bacterium]
MPEFKVPENELLITFSRSRGKGGQYLNKTSTKVTLKWDVYNSPILTSEQKYKILHKLYNRINEKGELVISAQAQRSQAQNRKEAITKLNNLVNQALQPQKKRIPTKPSKIDKEKRIRQKKKISEKKRLRKKIEI